MTTPKIKLKSELVVDQTETRTLAIKFRTKAGLTLSQVADEIQTSVSMVYYLETGKRKWTEENFKSYTDAVEKLTNQPA